MYMDSFFWGGGFEIMFTLVFVLIIGIFVVTAVKGLSQWNKNNHCPRLLVTASVVSKRTNVSRHSLTTAIPMQGTPQEPMVSIPLHPPAITRRSRWRAVTGWSSP